MPPRHPTAWLFTDERLGDLLELVRKLPRGTGVVLRHHELPVAERMVLKRRLMRVAAARDLRVVDQAGSGVARVHDARELRRALLAGKPLIFLSPLFPTRSHPDWPALPRMRAAALARLGGRRLLALGGMDERRFARVRALGFAGWGGIDGWQNLGKGRHGNKSRDVSHVAEAAGWPACADSTRYSTYASRRCRYARPLG